MIQIKKNFEPEILINNKKDWTERLDSLVVTYKGYSNIPDRQKQKALELYGHPDIINALKAPDSSAKCAFCESSVNVTSYLQVEHFHPKSKYWKETFEWDNLFVSCEICNGHKQNFDTKNEPFIHPSNDNPEDFLTYSGISIKPISTDPATTAYKKAWNVIDKCQLKRIGLSRALSDIALGFSNLEIGLIEKAKIYSSYKQKKRKVEIAKEILPVLYDLNIQASDNFQYAGYMRYLIRESIGIKQSLLIVNAHYNDIGLPSQFVWCFRY